MTSDRSRHLTYKPGPHPFGRKASMQVTWKEYHEDNEQNEIDTD